MGGMRHTKLLCQTGQRASCQWLRHDPLLCLSPFSLRTRMRDSAGPATTSSGRGAPPSSASSLEGMVRQQSLPRMVVGKRQRGLSDQTTSRGRWSGMNGTAPDQLLLDQFTQVDPYPVSYTHLRAHETVLALV